MFHRFISEPGRLLPEGTGWVATKVLVAAVGIAAISVGLGARPKRSPEDVARSITATVIASTALVLAIQVVFALIEF